MISGIVILAIVVAVAALVLFVYNKYKPGYVFENGTWNYVSYDTGVGRRVKPIDVDKDEFRELKYNDFARDDECVYFKAHRIEGSDPDTFEVISTKDRRNYAKDKNFVYVYVRDDWSIYKIYNADPETFEVLEFPYAKDKNDAYNGCLPLFVDDVTKFEVVEGSGMSSESPLESFFGTAMNSEEVAKYNQEKYGFVDGWVLYSRFGKAKTDNLVYEGHVLVEDKRG